MDRNFDLASKMLTDEGATERVGPTTNTHHTRIVNWLYIQPTYRCSYGSLARAPLEMAHGTKLKGKNRRKSVRIPDNALTYRSLDGYIYLHYFRRFPTHRL